MVAPQVLHSGQSSGRPIYIAHVVPGLEALATDDTKQNAGNAQPLDVLAHFDKRTSLVLFRSGAALPSLLGLRMLEDVFALVVDARNVPGGYSGTKSIRALFAAEKGMDAAATLASQVREKTRFKTTFRVVSRMAGPHAYRRADLQRAVELGIQDRFPDWLLVEGDAQFEIWVSLIDDRLVAGIRLSDDEMRARTYRRTSLPASLKPTVAYAMVQLSEPREDDVVLDPMCGAGTILVERALAGRYATLLGSDVDPTAVQATLDNVGPRYKPVEIRQWDARTLPQDDASVSALLTNMPFGKQIGSPEDNKTLYPALIGEFSRVVRPAGRMVLLTAERTLLRAVLSTHPELTTARVIDVKIRGYPAAIHVVRRS